MKTNRVYGFVYQGVKYHEPSFRRVLVEETDNTSVLGKLMEEKGFEAIRRFRFDRMKSEPIDITNEIEI